MKATHTNYKVGTNRSQVLSDRRHAHASACLKRWKECGCPVLNLAADGTFDAMKQYFTPGLTRQPKTTPLMRYMQVAKTLSAVERAQRFKELWEEVNVGPVMY